MNNKHLIWIFVLFLLVTVVKAYEDCDPPPCPEGYTENGTYCEGEVCGRICYTYFCDDSSWSSEFSQVFDDDGPGWWGSWSYHDGSSNSFNPSDGSKCYKFEYYFPNPSSSNILITPETDPVPPYNCDTEAIGGLEDTTSPTDPWFKDIHNSGEDGPDYLGIIDPDCHFNYFLKIMRAHHENLNHGPTDNAYAQDFGTGSSIFCAPTPGACENISSQQVDNCDINCYNHSTILTLAQGYLQDRGDPDATLYDKDPCGSQYVKWNVMYNAQFKVYSTPANIIQYNNPTCERTHEAPSVSNVKVIPLNPTAGDDLICNYTYHNPEWFVEKNPTYEWWKNGVNQNINNKTLDKRYTTPGETWYCKVMPSDGMLNGTKTQSENIVTIEQTVKNVNMYVGGTLVWGHEGYYNGPSVIYNFDSELESALEACVPDEEGYCDIELRFSSEESGKLQLSNLSIYYIERNEPPILNSVVIVPQEPYENETLSCGVNATDADDDPMNASITWFKNGESWIEDNEVITIEDGEMTYTSYIGDIESNKTTAGDVWICSAQAYDGFYLSEINYSDSVTINGPSIVITNFSELYSNNEEEKFEFVIGNLGDITIENINWTIDYNDSVIVNSAIPFSLDSDENIFIYAEHNYSYDGVYVVKATASGGGETTTEEITINVTSTTVEEQPLEISLNELYSDNGEKKFEFIIENIGNVTIENLNWAIDYNDSVIVNSAIPFSLDSNEGIFVYAEHNYSMGGTYVMKVTAAGEQGEVTEEFIVNVSMDRTDLIPISLMASSYNLNIGEEVTYTLNITNTGETDSGPFYSKINFSPIYAPWSMLYTSNLEHGQTATFVRQTRYNAPGVYNITAEVDWKREVNESDETNNFAQIQITVSGNNQTNQTQLPDLIPYNLTASKYSLSLNESVTYTLTLKNIGNSSSGAFYSNLSFHPTRLPWSGLYTQNLNPSQTAVFTRQTRYDQPGVYNINATVDWKGEVNETNETNNIAALYVTVT